MKVAGGWLSALLGSLWKPIIRTMHRIGRSNAFGRSGSFADRGQTANAAIIGGIFIPDYPCPSY